MTIVKPVVVSPETDSKTASRNDSEPLVKNGIAANKAPVGYDIATITIPSRNLNDCSGTKCISSQLEIETINVIIKKEKDNNHSREKKA